MRYEQEMNEYHPTFSGSESLVPHHRHFFNTKTFTQITSGPELDAAVQLTSETTENESPM